MGRPSWDLSGEWRIERLSGFLPPMVLVRKRIRGDRGVTALGPLPGWPFSTERRVGRVALIYGPPFSALVDEVWPINTDSWLGRSTLMGRELGRFRMVRSRSVRSKIPGIRDATTDGRAGVLPEREVRRAAPIRHLSEALAFPPSNPRSFGAAPERGSSRAHRLSWGGRKTG